MNMSLGVQNLGSKSEGRGGAGKEGEHTVQGIQSWSQHCCKHSRPLSHQRGCTEPLHNIFSSVQSSRSVVSDSVTSWTAAHQASLSIANSQSLLKLISIELVMPSNHLILCHPLLLLPSIFPSIRVFSNESVLRIRWPNYWSFSFSISPSNEYSGLMDWLDLRGRKKADN